MTHTPTVRPFRQEEWAVYKHLRLAALADSPDAFGSLLEREQSRSDADWASRLVPDEVAWNLPLLAEMEGKAVGLAWGRIVKADPAVAHLYQVWVAPEYRGLGIGRLLIEAVIAWARANRGSGSTRLLELGVTCGDTPARRLYESVGFQAVGAPEPLRPGSSLMGQTMQLKLD